MHATPLKNASSPSSQRELRSRKAWLIIRLLIGSTVVIYAIETLLMYLLEMVLSIPEQVVYLLDGAFLVAFLFPINYFLVVRPLSRQVEEHHRTNLELRHNYEVLERFFSISGVLIAYMDADFNFIRVSRSYADTDGRDPVDFIGRNHFDLFPNDENEQIFKQVVATGEPFNTIARPFEFAEHPERGVTYWDWSLLPVKGEDEQVVALILVLANVTPRVEAQRALVESERRFRASFNQTFQHIALLDPDGRVLLVNQTALDFFGAGSDPGGYRGQYFWQVDWWNPEIAGKLEASLLAAAAGETARCECPVRAADGLTAIMDITVKPMLNEKGDIVLLIYEARNITARIQVEQKLKKSEDEIKRLYQTEMRAHELAETLRRAGLALSGSLEMYTVLETLLDLLEPVVHYTSAHILLLEEHDRLVVRMARGESEWEPGLRLLDRRFDLAELPILQRVIARKEQVLAVETASDTDMALVPGHAHICSWLAIPLRAGEQVIGLCLLEQSGCDMFTPDLVDWAGMLVSQASVAIHNAWLFEQVQENRARLQALSRRLVEVQELERRHIARELHDEAGQGLASILVGLRLIERESQDPQAVTVRCQEVKGMADGVLEDLHRLAVALRPASLDHLGLVAALRQHTELVSDQHGLTVQFETMGKIDRLPGDTETAVYRIVQEALTNVIKHSHATRVDITLERRGDCLIVVVEDNGVGFDTHRPAIDQLGLVGMHERAEMLGGSINIESSIGRGTTIYLEVPCQFAS